MMFCEKCGAKTTAAFCPKCGDAKHLQLPQMNVTLTDSKYCLTCGKPVNAAYCPGCGVARASHINFGRAPAFGGGQRVAYQPVAGGAAPVATGLPFPVEWLLMGVVLLFAMATMPFFGALMLVAALVPAAVLGFNRELYNKCKPFLGAGALGLGLVFAILATVTGVLRFHPISLVLCILGLLFVAFVCVRDALGIKLPNEVEKILSIVESPMFFYIVAIYFAVVTVFLRRVVIWQFVFTREVYSVNVSAGRVMLSLIFIVLLLVPVSAVAYVIWRGMKDMVGKALIGLGGSAFLAIFIVPLFFRRQIGVPGLFVLAGFAAIGIAVLAIVLFKDTVMQVFGGGTGAPMPMAGQPYQGGNTYVPAPTGMAPGHGAYTQGQPPGGYGHPAPMHPAPPPTPMHHAPPPAPMHGGYGQPTVMGTSPEGATVNVNVTMPGYHHPGPVGQLKTNRSLLLFILLSSITCGIYPLIVMSSISTDINIIAQRYDGRKTMHFCLLAFVISPITCGIGTLVWYHNISDRIGSELRRRGIYYSFGAGTYWGWSILGSLLFGIGPLIYMYKMLNAMNMLSMHYNANG